MKSISLTCMGIPRHIARSPSPPGWNSAVRDVCSRNNPQLRYSLAIVTGSPRLSIGNTLVLGIGNRLLADEGVGVHAVELLASEHPDLPGISCIDGGTLSFTLADTIAAHDNLIVVDAARFGGAPGMVVDGHG